MGTNAWEMTHIHKCNISYWQEAGEEFCTGKRLAKYFLPASTSKGKKGCMLQCNKQVRISNDRITLPERSCRIEILNALLKKRLIM